MMNYNEKIKKYNRLINIMCWCATTFCLLEAIIMFVDIGTNFRQTLPVLYFTLLLIVVFAILVFVTIEIVFVVRLKKLKNKINKEEK